MPLSAGARLGPYEIIACIGAGGMGEVYRARDTKLGRDVAIKVLPELFAADPDRVARFRREAQVLASLNHPNIAGIYGLEDSGPVQALVLELVDGSKLADVVPKAGLPPIRLLRLAVQLTDAVGAAHQHGVVHRDLKPANVMVASDDRLKVLDFGLAKLSEVAGAQVAASGPTQEVTGEGKILGTAAYMAPEQAEGKRVDERSDIFSIGVILFEMATGRRPFSGDTGVSVLAAILRETPPAVSEVNPALPRELSRIVRRCLTKDPERRYQSAKDLRNDLEDLQQSINSGELAAVVVGHPARNRTRQLLGIMASVVVAASALFAGARFWSSARSVSLPLTAVHTRLTRSAGIKRFPCISPDGRWVVYSSAVSGNDDIYLQSVTGQVAINLTKDSRSSSTMPAFSPDGDTIAFRSERDGGGIFLMGRTGESVRRLTSQGYYPAWFPDGRRIVFSTGGASGPENVFFPSELWVVDVDGGEPRLLVQGDAVQPRVSPHALRIAYWGVPLDPQTKHLGGSSTGANRDIWTVDIAGDKPVRVTTHPANDWNPVWSPDGRWMFFLSNRSGVMNLWRIAIEEATGIVKGEPEPVAAPVPYVAHFTLSADGRIGAYSSLVSKGNIGRVGFDPRTGTATGSAEAITTGTHELDQFDVTADGRYVVARTSPRGQEDLYIVPVASGDDMRQLTNDFFRDRAPRWTPDGRHILFYSDRRERMQLWSINVDGSELRQLTSEHAWRGTPVPSHDGSRVAANDQNTAALFVYDTHDFSKAREVLPRPPPELRGVFPIPADWSPDDRMLAGTVVSRDVSGPFGAVAPPVWVYSFETRIFRRIATGGSPNWLRDGRRILFSMGGRLFITDVASGESREILAIPGEVLGGPKLAADDSQLFFVRTSADGDVWLARFESSPAGRGDGSDRER